VALNPVAPIAMLFVVVEFVVDDFTDQLPGLDWQRGGLRMSAKNALGNRQKPRS